MQSDKILVFDITGEYGHFRKFNTTTSPLTYPIPTRTALSGLIGAILGIERETSVGVFKEGVVPVCELFHPEKMSIAVQVLQPTKKINMAFNLLDTDKSPASYFNITNRTQIEFEFLKDPAFRIYFQHTDANVFDELADRIRNRNYHFTPYFGIAQLLASADFCGIFPCKAISNKSDTAVEIISAVNLSKLNTSNPIKFGTGHYTVDTYPRILQRDREVATYSEILVERKGKTTNVHCPIYWNVEGHGNILFL
jgi:CRISPR-associated protein Cas5h